VRFASLIVAVVGFALAFGPVSQAAPTTVVSYVGMAAGVYSELPVALAGDSIISVDWTHYAHKAPSRIRVLRRTPDGVTTTLATLPAPPKSTGYYNVMLRSSETTWAVGVRAVFRPDDPEDQAIVLSDLIAAGPVSGGAPRILARCKAGGALPDDEVVVAVAGDDVAWSNDECTGGNLAPAATHGGPIEAIGGLGSNVALTPTHIGFWAYDTQDKIPRIHVVDRATGAEELVDAQGVAAFVLGDGGLLAVDALDDPACNDNCTSSIMRVAGATITRPGIAPRGRGSGFAGDPEPFVAGGGRVLLERAYGNGVVAVDLATGARSYAGALGLDSSETPPIAVDATRAVYAGRRCDAHPALFFEDTVAKAPARRQRVPCPVHVLSHTATLHLTTRSARVRIRCPRGCDGRWYVSIPGIDLDFFEFHAAPGAVRSGTIHVTRREARKLRGRVRVAATLQDDNDGAPRTEQRPIHLTLKIRP